MKFFKNELVNREKNYNGLFNANPNIGVMNPLEDRVMILFILCVFSLQIKKLLKIRNLIHRNQMILLLTKKNEFII